MEHKLSSTALSANEAPVTPKSVILKYFLQAQKKDKFCRERVESAREPQSCFCCKRYKVLVRTPKLDGALERNVPERIRLGVPNLLHYPVVAGHPGGTQM